jgi:hypothetical protein
MISSIKYTAYLIIFSLVQTLTAQNEFIKWYFGQQAGLDFSTSPPTALTNGIMGPVEGVATINDSWGNLLFYASGNAVVNSNHSVMANGLSLNGDASSTQGAIIVKQPGNTNLYYIFTTDDVGAAKGQQYSIVDMSLAAGLGSVTVKNATLYTPTCEKQVAVRHCNGRDIWIVSHHFGSNEFRSYLLEPSGLTGPVISAVGETIGAAPYGAIATIGQLKISPDGKKLAIATASSSVPSTLGLGGFQLFDFDASSGIVSNSLTLLSNPNLTTGAGAYGVEFSPDGTKLYGSTSPNAAGSSTCALYQWDICAGTNAAIIASQYSVNLSSIVLLGSLQRAIDGKIYIASSGSLNLSVINNPKLSGSAMGLSLHSVSLGGKTGALGLPNYINPYSRGVLPPFTNSIACQNVTFSTPSRTFSSGCSSTPYNPTGYLWDFGEPSSGAANTSTVANPSHYYAGLGTYTVKLILYSPCTNDTLTQSVNITTMGPPVNVTGLFTVCNGDNRTYTASGGSSYLWSTNAAASTVALSPSVTTPYSVTGTADGCSTTKVFTVNVNKCLAVSGENINNSFSVYPNPFKENIIIEALNSGSVIIFDVNGKRVFEKVIQEGKNEVSTTGLDAGIYTIQLNGINEADWRERLIKVNMD